MGRSTVYFYYLRSVNAKKCFFSEAQENKMLLGLGICHVTFCEYRNRHRSKVVHTIYLLLFTADARFVPNREKEKKEKKRGKNVLREKKKLEVHELFYLATIRIMAFFTAALKPHAIYTDCYGYITVPLAHFRLCQAKCKARKAPNVLSPHIFVGSLIDRCMYVVCL